ncbi:hypothetical protein [Castellaniella caeni]|uniref:hypothetical protein n=1 Tax=Castellaniella caeni TaxID=266123 RepID=UPI000C9EEE94|nr:hypothetical protein [Castellaniella caeni]
MGTNVKTLQRSFAGGEIGPELHGRIDLTKYQTGLSRCENFIVLPHGPVQNRPGFEYLNLARAQDDDVAPTVRILPFSFNTEQTYVIELGAGYIRFHTQGATLLGAASLGITDITQGNPCEITYVGDAPDEGAYIYLVGIEGMTWLNGRFLQARNVVAAANTFEVWDDDGPLDSTNYPPYTTGGTVRFPYSLTTDYTEAELFDIRFVQSADVLTLVHPAHPPRELRRLGATSWALVDIEFLPTIAAPGAPTVTAHVAPLPSGAPADIPVEWFYKVTAVAADTLEESLASESASASVDLSRLGNYNSIVPPAVEGAVRYNIYKLDGVYGYIGQSDGGEFRDVNITANISQTPPENKNPFTTHGISSVPVVAGGTGYGAAATLEVTDDTGSGAKLVPIIDGEGVVTGVRVDSPGKNYTAPTVTWTDEAGGSGAEFGTAELTPANFPGAVGYYEQRRCFAGTDAMPQNFWATRSATENNISYSIPTRDDDSIQFRIAAREVNRVQHILSLDVLILLTTGGEWKIAPQNSDVLTPTSASPKQFSAEGASRVPPVLTAGSVIFVQEAERRLREMKYKWEANGLTVDDISLMAPHLFDDYKIIDMAYAKSPHRLIWCARSDGALLCLTYLPEQQVFAWSQHKTDGKFKSIACIQEDGEYVLYAIVERTLQGKQRNCVERMRQRISNVQANAYFVDCGLTYAGPQTSTVRGLWHLEGHQVTILADGAVVPTQVVQNGAITLAQPASTIHIGLPMTAYLQTLPLSFEAQAAGQGYTKNINTVYFRVRETSGVEIGPSFDELSEWTLRRSGDTGLSPALYTGLSEFPIMPEWGVDASVCIRQAAPLPATILSMTIDTTIGG